MCCLLLLSPKRGDLRCVVPWRALLQGLMSQPPQQAQTHTWTGLELCCVPAWFIHGAPLQNPHPPCPALVSFLLQLQRSLSLDLCPFPALIPSSTFLIPRGARRRQLGKCQKNKVRKGCQCFLFYLFDTSVSLFPCCAAHGRRSSPGSAFSASSLRRTGTTRTPRPCTSTPTRSASTMWPSTRTAPPARGTGLRDTRNSPTSYPGLWTLPKSLPCTETSSTTGDGSCSGSVHTWAPKLFPRALY